VQEVPRPSAARLGEPAPWAGLPADRRRGITLARVAAALDAAGVGTGGPLGTSGVGTGGPLDATDGRRPAAVLVALFEERGETRVLLTRRSGRLRSHRHQVSFPGGGLEPGETAEQAARREAAEEVGLDPASVHVVGRLSPLVTVSSWRLMVPVVATLPGRPAVRPNPAEVARVFDVALADLVADGVGRRERWPVPAWVWELDGGRRVGSTSGAAERSVWFFDVAGETIWGATARVLAQLLTLVLTGSASTVEVEPMA